MASAASESFSPKCRICSEGWAPNPWKRTGYRGLHCLPAEGTRAPEEGQHVLPSSPGGLQMLAAEHSAFSGARRHGVSGCPESSALGSG